MTRKAKFSRWNCASILLTCGLQAAALNGGNSRLWTQGQLAPPILFKESQGLEFTGAGEPKQLTNGGQPNQQPHTVKGTVVNSITGEPIYRALVQIGGEFATLTDHEGRFEFEGVTEGIPPWAMKPGYFAENGMRQFGGRFGGSQSQPDDAPVVVRLVPEAVLSGTVLGADGGPLEGIPVQLKVLTVNDGLLRWQQRQGTTTNSEGKYRFADLEAGKYAVVTGFHTEGLPDAQSSVAYVPARNPALAAGTAESALMLAAGEHREANLSPDVEKLYPVTGALVGNGENRGVNFRVETADGEEISAVSRFNFRTGEFRLMLPGGSYTVTATSYLQRGPLEARRQLTVPQAPVAGVNFALQPYATIPLEVAMESVNPPGQGEVQPSLMSLASSLSLISTDPALPTNIVGAQPLRRHGGDDAEPATGGQIALENVAPGRYLLQGGQEYGWYVASANCGGVDLMREELVVGGAAAGCTLRVVMRNDVGSAHVTVRDGRQSSVPISVYMLPVGDSVRRVAMPSGGNSNSEFHIDGLAPGRYWVLALDQRVQFAYRDPESMRRYAGLGQEITVTTNGTAEVEVALVRGEI